MNEAHITSQLRDIFSVVFSVPPEAITLEFSPDNCDKWDSLQHIHLVNAISEGFGIELTIEQQMEIMSFDLAIEVVQEAFEQPKEA